MHEPIILASASPQRAKLLDGLGWPFVVVQSHVDEMACTENIPAKRAALLAREKAMTVAELHRGRWVLGCDTLVETEDGQLLEKPVDADDARRMLQIQSGRISTVHSGLCLIGPRGDIHEGISSSMVHFLPLSEQMLQWWIQTMLWEGRSGGFQIDGKGQLMIRHLEGDWSGVVGLPVCLLGQLAREAGMPHAG